jgi:hypothetical protein
MIPKARPVAAIASVVVMDSAISRPVRGGGAVCSRVPRMVSAQRNRHHSDTPRWVRSRASVAIQGIEQNFTPWAGAFERINAYTYFAWLVVLAVTVHRSIDWSEVALRRDNRRSEPVLFWSVGKILFVLSDLKRTENGSGRNRVRPPNVPRSLTGVLPV